MPQRLNLQMQDQARADWGDRERWQRTDGGLHERELPGRGEMQLSEMDRMRQIVQKIKWNDGFQ
jgi:hypothetical protein